MLFLDFENNAILLCCFFFLLIIDLYFLIYAAIAQIFNPIAKPVIPTEVPNKEEKTDMETHPLTVEP